VKRLLAWFGLPQASIACPSCGETRSYLIPLENQWVKTFVCEVCGERMEVAVRNGLIVSIAPVVAAD